MRLARELVATIRQLNRMIAELDQELEARTAEVAPALLELPAAPQLPPPSCWPRSVPSTASRATRNSLGTAASHRSKQAQARTQRHRLDRGGNRQLNAALYRIAITQSRYYPPARAYLERKKAEGKSRREAIRCLKRLLARVVFNTLKASPALT